MTPEQKFINAITAELKTQSGFNLREEVFFPLRYNKKRPITVQHREIARDLMPKEDPRLGLGDYVTSIGTTSQNVVQAIAHQYQDELKQDGVDLNILVNGNRGQRGTWQAVYYWLWNHKYPRWLNDNSWKILQEKAKPNLGWIEFKTDKEMAEFPGGTKAPSLRLPPPSVPEIPPTIPANQLLWMRIDLEYSNYQLLLFNRSQQGKYLLCPSFGYAKNSIIDKPPILLPQKDSFADQTGQKFIFEEMGKEEFLAIAVEKPLNLPWLTPKQEEALPEWNAERIKELFEQLEQQDQWHIFYQSFDVVERETEA
jgi:hypothetical protein